MSSATKAPGAEGPSDWVLVPREPLPEMLGAFWRTKNTGTTEIGGKYQDSSDVAAYRAMIAAAPFNTTAPTPTDRVGEDGLGDGRAICEVLGFDPINHHNAERCPYCNPNGWTLQPAPAPSDPAGAGGDLGELERLSKAATQGEWSQDDGSDGGPSLPEEHRIYGDTNGGYLVARVPNFSGYPENEANAAYIVALVNAHRSGQLVASTPGQKGAGGEKTSASFGPGSREPGPSVPASGFDPSRAALRALRIGDMVRVKQNLDQPWTFDWQDGPYEVIGLALDRHGDPTVTLSHDGDVGSDGFDPSDLVLAASCDGSAEGGETEGLDPKGNSAVGEAETPAQTPPSPPSATPEGDPPMTVVEARALLSPLRVPPEIAIANWRQRAQEAALDLERKTYAARADEVELALRIIHAAGEVRPLQIREGAYYASAAGERIGPMHRIQGDAAQVWYARGQKGDWLPDGRALHSSERDNLVVEWSETQEGAR